MRTSTPQLEGAIELGAHVSGAELRSRPRHPFDFWARAVFVSTIILGALVALAPAIPAAVRSHGVFAGLVVWTGVVVWGTIAPARLATRSLRRDFASAATVLAVLGFAVTVLASTQLEIIRVLYHRPALTWTVDWLDST